MSAALDRVWRNPLDQEHRARIAEYEINAKALKESRKEAIARFGRLAGRAAAPDEGIAVEATAQQLILRVEMPGRDGHASLVLPTVARAVQEEARRKTLAAILDNRESRAELWRQIQKIAQGAFTGDPASAAALRDLLDIRKGDEKWAPEVAAEGYLDDEYDYWPEGEPRVEKSDRHELRQALKEWTPALDLPEQVPGGYLRSRTEREEWDDVFGLAAQKALAGDAAAVKKAREILARPVRAGLVLPTGESCLAAVQNGRIVGVEFPGQLGREGDPLGQLVFWAYGSAVDRHQESWYTEVADHLPSPQWRNPSLPRRYRAFKPVPYLDENPGTRKRREAFQEKTTTTVVERH
jgi:hypothetical protein